MNSRYIASLMFTLREVIAAAEQVMRYLDLESILVTLENRA